MKNQYLTTANFTLSAHQKAMMTSILKGSLCFLAVSLIAVTAQAAGFEDSAKKADKLFKDILKWAVVLAGSAGAVYLLIKFVQAWNGHSDWLEFLKFAFFYACAGGVTTIAAYIFGAFK